MFAQAAGEFAVGIIRWKAGVTIVFVGIEAKVLIGVFTVEQSGGEAANHQEFIEGLQRCVVDGVGVLESVVVRLLGSFGIGLVILVDEIAERLCHGFGDRWKSSEAFLGCAIDVQFSGFIRETVADRSGFH